MKCNIDGCGSVYVRVSDLIRHLQREHCITEFKANYLVHEWGYKELQGTVISVKITKKKIDQMKEDLDLLFTIL